VYTCRLANGGYARPCFRRLTSGARSVPPSPRVLRLLAPHSLWHHAVTYGECCTFRPLLHFAVLVAPQQQGRTFRPLLHFALAVLVAPQQQGRTFRPLLHFAALIALQLRLVFFGVMSALMLSSLIEDVPTPQ
jgi:hypothetical protein